MLFGEIRLIDREFIETFEFSRKWKESGLSDADLIALQNMIMMNPKIGDVIKGTDGLRKIRFAIPGKGKSGSMRACYVDLENVRKLF